MAYTAELVKDLDVTKPTEGSTAPSEVNDAIRELARVIKNSFAVAVKTASYTLTNQDTIILGNLAGITLTLPQGSTVANSTYAKIYLIKNILSTGNITIARSGTDTFDGATSLTVGPGDSVYLASNGGTDWKGILVNTHASRHNTGGADALTGNLDAIAKSTVRKNTGADVGSRRRFNLIEGNNITLTVADVSASEEINITITAPVAKSYFAQVVNDSTSSLGYVAIGAGLSITFTPAAGVNVILIDATVCHSNPGARCTIGLFQDGSLITNAEMDAELSGRATIALHWRIASLSAASHTFEVKWKTASGTQTLSGGGAILRIAELY